MCYKSPGPRCSRHATERLEQAEKSYQQKLRSQARPAKNAKQERQRQKRVAKAFQELEQARSEWERTPAGIAEVAKTDPERAQRLKDERQAALDAYKRAQAAEETDETPPVSSRTSEPKPQPKRSEPRVARVTLSGLKERGWTEAAVRRFLGDPDATARNPHSAKAAPMRLYDEERVEAVERTDAWQQWKQARESRTPRPLSGAAAHAVARKEAYERLVHEVAEREAKRPFRVRVQPVEQVRAAAIRSYNERALEQGTWLADKNSDPDFLDRITVNHIRHNLTDYEGRLANLEVDDHRVYDVVKTRVLEDIAEAYPDLDAATDLQHQRHYDFRY